MEPKLDEWRILHKEASQTTIIEAKIKRDSIRATTWQPIGNLNYLLTLICLRGKWLDLGVSFCRKESCKCDL
uniref:Uncharacterized protein n=1 Tax=Rhizophora mucronata TaxID=61149 RepID=A0A2P2LF13_RHIMU